jgi:predicted HicB family RNase H-like nuclease
VPFAVKLPAELSEALRQQAQAQGVRLDDLVAELLRAGLGR